MLARWQIAAERAPISAVQMGSLRLAMQSNQLRAWLSE
jgi:hypothetical protein